MLTNPRDAFRDPSRSNIVAFHMLSIVSSCAIVTLYLRRADFRILDIKKCPGLHIHAWFESDGNAREHRSRSFLCAYDNQSRKRHATEESRYSHLNKIFD